MDFESLVPVSQDLQFYILEWPLDHTEDGKTEAVSMVIMKRGGGFLLCLPLDFLPPEVAQEGNSGNAGAVGPSHEVRVGAVVLDGGQESPVGEELAVLVVDMDVSVASSMRPMADVEDIAVRFMPDDPHAYPQPGELVAKTFEWLQSMEPQMSAEWYPLEVSAESGREEPKRTPRPKQQAAFPGGATPTGGGSKAKKPTAASLAVSMQQVLDALPALSNQIQMISDRQSEMEEKLGRNPSVAALSKPLALNLPTGSQSQVASMARELRSPPRTTMRSSTSTPIRDLVPVHVEELQKDKELTSEPKDVTQAILAQSAALTALVAQLSAGQDPMHELAGPSGGTRGAQGRARLQSELALHRGTFFQSMVHSMARRMSPTSNPEIPHGQLLANGISGTRYLERFGGYGRQRELGLIQFQLMTMVDFVMSENWGAAKDTLGLLVVMIEQACLDQGKFDLAQLLTLQEDPPSGVFTNRQLSQVSRAKAFSPLADQRWVTVALAFLKELDTISTKRSELLQASQSGGGQPSQPLPKSPGAPGGKGRGRGRGKKQQQEAEDLEQA